MRRILFGRVAPAALLAVPFLSSAAVPEQREWIGAKSGGIPPTATPLVWDLPANWQNNTPPSTKNDLAHFGGMTGAALVRMPDDVTFGALRRDGSGTGFYLVGKNLVLDGSAWTTAGGSAKIAGGRLVGYNGTGTFEARVYANVTNYRDLSGQFAIAGDLVSPQVTASIAQQWWRGDWYANSDSEDRTGSFDIGWVNNSTGALGFRAAGGTSARDSSGWYQISGSAYLSYVGSSIGVIAPGCRVSGDGIPAGTYLRRYFPDLKLIELSAPVTETLASNVLHFDAYHPVTTGHITTLSGASNSDQMLYVYMSSAGGTFTLTADSYAVGATRVNVINGGTYPGKLVLRNTTGALGTVGFRYNTHVCFPQPTGGKAGFAKAKDIQFQAFDSTARIEVEEGVEAIYTNVTVMGASHKVVKSGPGSLTLDLATAVQSVPATVAEGGLIELHPRTTQPVTLASVSVSSNATYAIACEGTATVKSLTGRAGSVVRARGGTLSASALSCEPGATLQADAGVTVDLTNFTALPTGLRLEGPGTFLVTNLTALAGVVASPDAVIRLVKEADPRGFKETETLVPEVVGEPALWVDATKNVTLFTTNGVNPVSRKPFNYTDCVRCWHDCRVRAGSSAYRDVYATNDFSQIETPNGWAPSRQVAFGGFTTIRHMCDAYFATTVAGTNNARNVYAGMVWNKPITNICSVFTVCWQNGGEGQAILGGTHRFWPKSDRGDFCRALNGPTDAADKMGGPASPLQAFFFSARAREAARNGWIYVNGVKKTWNDPCYVGTGQIEIRESHTAEPGGRADAFAIQDYGNAGTFHHSGLQIQIETIVYTNALTMAERERVYAYLARKYLKMDYASGSASRFVGEDGHALELPVAEGSHLSVSVDDTVVIDRLSGKGTLAQTGSGTLYADLVEGVSLRVDGGTMVVHSAKRPQGYDDLPAVDHAIHWDAASTNMTTRTITDTYADGALPLSRTVTNEVTHWYDARFGNDGRHPYGTSRKSDLRYRAGWLVTNALNGLPAVDYGPIYKHTDGLNQARRFFHEMHLTDANVTVRAAPVRSIFQIKNTADGGTWALGDTSGYHGIHRASTSADYTVAITDQPCIGGSLNGRDVDPTKVGYSGGWDLLTLHCQRTFDGDLMGANGGFQPTGGMKLGEVLIYTNALSWSEAHAVEAYLAGKWLNRLLPYAAPSTAGVVVVSSGARLIVEGGEPLVASTLTGGGTVDGAVALTGDTELEIYVDANGIPQIAPTTVIGAVDVSAGGTVRVTGYVERARAGVYPIIAASSVKSGLWRCVAEGAKRSIKVRFNARAMNLVVTGCGGAIIVR